MTARHLRAALAVTIGLLLLWRGLIVLTGLPPFLRIGTWVGGDRDGNPNVDAAVMAAAFRTQSRAVLRFYLEEVNALGEELSLSADLTAVTPELSALAQSSADASIQRADEPYRRALSRIYAQLSATH